MQQAHPSEGSSTYGYGQPARQDDDDFDAGYRQWRNEQVRRLDEDYRVWRAGGGYKTFSDEFARWREQRTGRPSTSTGPSGGSITGGTTSTATGETGETGEERDK